jgi:UDP-glucose 4-epimerase
MRALVIGGAGFIGSHLADALVREGCAVRILDNFATGQRENVNSAADVIEGDIREIASIRPAFAGVDCVFHTAALPRVMLSIEHPVETHMVNVVGTLNALIAARDAKVGRFIYSGSSSVYGDQDVLPLRETMTPNPLNPYALQKLAGEQYTRMFHRLFGMPTLTLRYFNVYGPRMTTEGAYVTVIGVFIRERLAGRPLTIHGDGSQTRDFTHVSDVVRANLAAMKCAIADGRAINIGRGSALSVNSIAAIVGGPVVHRERRPGDPRATLADLNESRKVLGWEPQADTAAAVRELAAAAGCPTDAHDG